MIRWGGPEEGGGGGGGGGGGEERELGAAPSRLARGYGGAL